MFLASLTIHHAGRLLTTPTRLLKLILPMPFHPKQEHVNEPVENGNNKDDTVEPLALLVHPQQPLSYLERLIQAEIPPLRQNGRDKLPDIIFRAEADQDDMRGNQEVEEGNVASYSGLGHEGPNKKHTRWVRWSGSTEVGDFIRDAARGREFAIDIEGGFFALTGWWGIVYYITFHTDMGWDLVEPVTYLVGLTTVLGGYWWFLYISRDLSYRTAMKITVSKRQSALYQERGFDAGKWEHLVHEANMLRREIRMAAEEYDVEWNETKDLGGEEVKEVLEAEKRKGNGGSKSRQSRDDEDDDDDERPSERSQDPSKDKD
ncbi:hypothetical protein BGZ63DRAFT_382875 [Mariannaea sp. PMI_226]|nr:hypothetical protein BGZ63DRAFT_382875 [Mariannaea sp. PMI_226]